MHVLILCQAFPPANRTGARRPYQLARRLVDRGHRVTVICEDTDTPDGWNAPLEGIDVHRLPKVNVPRDSSGLLRVAHVVHRMLRGHALLRPIGDLWGDLVLPPNPLASIDLVPQEIAATIDRPSLIVASGPPWNYAGHARALAAAWSVPFALDYRDPWNIADPMVALSALNRRQGLRGAIIRWRQCRLERSIGRSAACITAATGPFLANALSIIGPQTALTVQNGCNISGPARRPDRKRFTITYTGAIYREQEWELVAGGMKMLQDERPDVCANMEVRLIGISNDRREAALDRALERLTALPWVSVVQRLGRDEALQAQQGSDLLLHVGFKGKHGILPLKFLEYVGSGIPVLQVSTGQDLPERILADTRTGFVADSPAALKDLLVRLHTTWTLQGSIPMDPDVEQLAQHRWEYRMDSWVDLLENVVIGNRSASIDPVGRIHPMG
jgi:glycosyltransferase involved in cell wall biosynthesis